MGLVKLQVLFLKSLNSASDDFLTVEILTSDKSESLSLVEAVGVDELEGFPPVAAVSGRRILRVSKSKAGEYF